MSDLPMRAYYYEFEPTGVEIVDRILSEVAQAGKRSHHTREWNDIDIHERGEFTAQELIQAAADLAAEEMRRLHGRLEVAEEAAEPWYWEWLVDEGTNLLSPLERDDD